MTASEPDREGRDGDVPAPDQEPGPPLDVDTAFAAIVAGWSDEPGDTPGSWPAQEDLTPARPRETPGTGDTAAPDDSADPDGRTDPDARTVAPAGAGAPPMIPSLDIGPSQAERDLDERFVPPEPPPIPRGDLISRMAWAGVLGGPLFLLLAAMLWKTAPQLFVLAAVVAFVAGFITLVARMPQHHDDDGDDGAVV